jgi:hypothetical protein
MLMLTSFSRCSSRRCACSPNALNHCCPFLPLLQLTIVPVCDCSLLPLPLLIIAHSDHCSCSPLLLFTTSLEPWLLPC